MKIKDLSLLTPEQKVELILLQSEENNLLKEELKKYKAKIKGLESRFSKNSRNSHKAPSSDQKKTQSTKPKSKNKPGGQAGHKGHHLKMSTVPDSKPTAIITLSSYSTVVSGFI
jgi:transposase